MSENKSNPKIEVAAKAAPGDGIRSMKATMAFRAINFELYAKPSMLMKLQKTITEIIIIFYNYYSQILSSW